MAAAANWNCKLIKSAILGHSDPPMASVYLRTKFDTNIFIGDRDMAQKYKCEMAAAAILNVSKSAILW